jgi:hypothetical protein
MPNIDNNPFNWNNIDHPRFRQGFQDARLPGEPTTDMPPPSPIDPFKDE